MSLGLQATKRRISSVNSTKKITNAMKLVATSKLRIWKNKLQGTNVYTSSLHRLMGILLNAVSEEDKKEVFGSTCLENKSLYIVVTSTLGLCGGYNYNLYKILKNKIDKKNDIVLIIGSKGLSYFTRNGYNVDSSFVDILSHLDLDSTRKLRNHLMSYLHKGQVSDVKIAYTSFKNSITFIPTIEDVYPITLNEEIVLSNKEKEMLIEPNSKEVLKSLVPLYLESMIQGRLIESSVSEQASRSNAMDTATENAGEIIEKLQIQYNKARQQAITQEITEIVGGANAQ